ncbi:MAG: tetratricopeptide repeat protein [Melioribacteraceae bacterium]
MKKSKITSRKYLVIILILLLFYTNIIFAQENDSLKSLLVTGEYNTIVKILEEKLTWEDSLTFFEYNILGNSYQRLMNFNKAIALLYEASKLQPSNIQNLILLGSCYDANGDEISAKLTFMKVLEIDSLNQIAMINLGKILIDIEEFNLASNFYKKLIQNDSTNSYFFAQLGMCELKKGNSEKAKVFFEKSTELHSANAKIILMLAKLYYNENELEKAKELLKFGLTHNSKNKQLNKMLADILYKEKLYNETIMKYLYAITINDTSANVYQKLGLSYYYLSFTNTYINSDVRSLKLREGINALLVAVDKDENDPTSFLYLGLCYKELEINDTAITYFEKTLNKIFPDYLSEVYMNMAGSFDEIGNYVNAIKSYKESLNYNLDKKIVNFYLANIYERYYSDKNVAVLYYKKFVDESVELDEKLINYSLERIKTLTKENNFWQNVKTSN